MKKIKKFISEVFNNVITNLIVLFLLSICTPIWLTVKTKITMQVMWNVFSTSQFWGYSIFGLFIFIAYYLGLTASKKSNNNTDRISILFYLIKMRRDDLIYRGVIKEEDAERDLEIEKSALKNALERDFKHLSEEEINQILKEVYYYEKPL